MRQTFIFTPRWARRLLAAVVLTSLAACGTAATGEPGADAISAAGMAVQAAPADRVAAGLAAEKSGAQGESPIPITTTALAPVPPAKLPDPPTATTPAARPPPFQDITPATPTNSAAGSRTGTATPTAVASAPSPTARSEPLPVPTPKVDGESADLPSSAAALAQVTAPPAAGDLTIAPTFTLASAGGAEVSLASYAGHKNVVLTFYRAFW